MWTEIYRPKRVEELVGQEAVVKRLKGFVAVKTVPNLLLWGPKGTGKTSMVYALATELYDNYAENLMFVECADFSEQRKKWLRDDDRFKHFYSDSKSAMDIFKGMLREYATLSPITAEFKLLVFNNADLLPVDAQQALRRTMERSNKTSRFIFCTTKPAGVIPAIRSRCLNLYFRSLAKSGALDTLLKAIAQKEGIELSDGGLLMLKRYAQGDAGAAINMLEAASASSSQISGKALKEVVRTVFRQRTKVDALIESVFAGKSKDIRTALEKLIKDERKDGQSFMVLLHEALRRKMNAARSDPELFARLMLYESETDYELCYSLNNMIHIEEMMMKWHQQQNSGGSKQPGII